ncbi:hypothetical protein LSCM1_01402 [Leishmania martiniquensis]|uniref:SET domain-containing protein n=1 Tax=Leishmania martiniquensis TaxID=1580590 RepID=A0A836KML7_9TRYP|nr:hypothetical protein LSCM1_01402 [Leishmania martiniquensis]
MRCFYRWTLLRAGPLSLSLRGAADENRPGVTPRRDDWNAVGEELSGGASVTSRQPTSANSSSASDLGDDVTDGLRERRVPRLDDPYVAKWRCAGPQSFEGQQRAPRQRQRQRSLHTKLATNDRVREGMAAGERQPAASERPPLVHPGAILPPLTQGAHAERRAGKFSFLSDPKQRAGLDVYGHEVPGNTPKPMLPMWASSLTSPALGKVRLVEESWISRDARGVLGEELSAPFVRWLCERVLPPDAALREQLEANVLLDLRLATARGVYARRAFKKGDVVLTIPLLRGTPNTPLSSTPWLTLNSETLATNSVAAQQRVGRPSYETVKRIISVRRSSFDPIPHPVFVDQVCAALLLACERADGEHSPLYPYLRLLDAAELFDDDAIKALHLGVLEPMTHMEYGDHVLRFRHHLRQLHAAWWAAYDLAAGQRPDAEIAKAETDGVAGATVPDVSVPVARIDVEDTAVPLSVDAKSRSGRQAGEGAVASAASTAPDVDASATRTVWKPPPSLEDMEWALRIVLSRQKVLPHLRVNRAAFERAQTENVEGEELDAFGRAVMRGKYAFYQYGLRAIDEERLHMKEADPTGIPTIVPLLDMVNHPPGGVPNVSYTVEKVGGGGDESTLGAKAVPSSGGAASDPSVGGSPSFQVVVRAVDDIEEDEELTLSYVKCYSVAYTLYRYGFLPLSRREDDMAALLQANGLDGNMRPARDSASSPSSARQGSVMSAVRRWWSSVLANRHLL